MMSGSLVFASESDINCSTLQDCLKQDVPTKLPDIVGQSVLLALCVLLVAYKKGHSANNTDCPMMSGSFEFMSIYPI